MVVFPTVELGAEPPLAALSALAAGEGKDGAIEGSSEPHAPTPTPNLHASLDDGHTVPRPFSATGTAAGYRVGLAAPATALAERRSMTFISNHDCSLHTAPEDGLVHASLHASLQPPHALPARPGSAAAVQHLARFTSAVAQQRSEAIESALRESLGFSREMLLQQSIHDLHSFVHERRRQQQERQPVFAQHDKQRFRKQLPPSSPGGEQKGREGAPASDGRPEGKHEGEMGSAIDIAIESYRELVDGDDDGSVADGGSDADELAGSGAEKVALSSRRASQPLSSRRPRPCVRSTPSRTPSPEVEALAREGMSRFRSGFHGDYLQVSNPHALALRVRADRRSPPLVGASEDDAPSTSPRRTPPNLRPVGRTPPSARPLSFDGDHVISPSARALSGGGGGHAPRPKAAFHPMLLTMLEGRRRIVVNELLAFSNEHADAPPSASPARSPGVQPATRVPTASEARTAAAELLERVTIGETVHSLEEAQHLLELAALSSWIGAHAKEMKAVESRPPQGPTPGVQDNY